MDTHPDGKVWASREEEEKEDPLMYSLSVPYTEIKPVRAALSSFAVQKCAKKLTAEGSKSVQLTTAFTRLQRIPSTNLSGRRLGSRRSKQFKPC
jgi:hypothetical protein